jgi:hypothetical protein
MRTLLAALILASGTAIAADEGEVRLQPVEQKALSGSSIPPRPVPAAVPATVPAVVPAAPLDGTAGADEDRQRHLMMLLMMRDAAAAFPELLMRGPD